ncbi:hypothetical protein CCHL11_05192 [Colletotrichum chlorophyti]|uniref:CCD97-like C-terminal domain-containing protein n=1 Tax=Colletotrichum chlorophyti TaxID=708187 RepID=A0A1Q8RNZ7_9PEZI|nr:hypothetical protein CCHL11_05192 [Colletotrichum chlorophyti]
MPSFDEPEVRNLQYDKPTPRPPRSPARAKDIRSYNRRREYLNRNPSYFENTEHELADPLLYDKLIRKFQTPAEREAEGRSKGYSRVLESSLLRGEARLADLKSSTDSSSAAAQDPTREFTTQPELSKPQSREEGVERWCEFLTERFVHGHDDDFDYAPVDQNEDLDVMERRDAEEAWFDAEDPSWASDADEDVVEREKPKRGETGIQDF